MEKNVINVLPSVIDYLDELIIKLYENEYFGFLESAKLMFQIFMTSFRNQLKTRRINKLLPNLKNTVNFIFLIRPIKERIGIFSSIDAIIVS